MTTVFPVWHCHSPISSESLESLENSCGPPRLKKAFHIYKHCKADLIDHLNLCNVTIGGAMRGRDGRFVDQSGILQRNPK